MPINKDDFIEERGGAMIDDYLDTIAEMLLFGDHTERRLKRYPQSAERDALIKGTNKLEKLHLNTLETLAVFVQAYMDFVGVNGPPPP